jgi:hypothetical protein
MGWVRDRLDDAEDAVSDAVEWVADEVIEPAVELVGDVIQSALDNPVKTVAQIYAIVTPGMQWLLPVIEGVDVAAKGGDLEDVAKAVAISVIAQEAGSRVGQSVSASTSNAATAANYGTNYASQQTAALAAQEAGMQTAGQIAGNIAGSAAASGTVAVVTGQDPVKAMVAGGVNAAVPAVLGQVEGFRNLTPSTQKIIETAVKTQLAGGDVGAAVIRSAIVSSQLATDTIRKLDPNNTLSRGQQSILADVVTAASVAAFTNGNVNSAIQKELFNAGAKVLGDMAKGKFTELTTGTQKSSEKISNLASQIEANEAKQNLIVNDYKVVADQLNTRIAEQDRLKKLMDDEVFYANSYVKEYNAGNYTDRDGVQKFIDRANKAVENYNAYVTSLNTDYEKYFKPTLDKAASDLNSLKIPHEQLVADFGKEQENLKNLASQLGKEVETIQRGVERSFVGVMDTNFNPDEYRKINKLDASVDPYSHWLSTGQYQNLPTNYKAAESATYDEQARLLTESLAARDLKLTNLTKEDRNRFYETIEKKYGSDYSALRNATIADLDIDNIFKTSSSLTVNQDFSKEAYSEGNRPSPTTYSAPDGYKLASQDDIYNDRAILTPTSNGSFAWLTEDPTTRTDGYFWDPQRGEKVLRISITGVGSQEDTGGVNNTLSQLRDNDPLGWFEMFQDFLPDDKQKAGLGEDVYNFIKDAYSNFKGSLDPGTQQALAKFAAAAKPESTTIDLLSGVLNGFKAITDAFGADNSVSKAIGNARGYLQSLYSAEAIGDKRLQSQIIAEARDKGVLDQVIAAVEAIAAYPGVMVEAAGTIVPTVMTAMASSVMGAAPVVARLSQYGVGAVSGAGIIKGTIYEETKAALIAAGVDRGTAELKAQQAQAYNGKNLDSIVAGALLGVVAGGTGVEKAVVAQVAGDIADRVAAKTLAKQFVVGGLKEGIPEAAQGGQEKLAENIALQREGFAVPTWRGVAVAGTLEGLAGAPIGGATDVASKLDVYDKAYTSVDELKAKAAEENFPIGSNTSSLFSKYSGYKDEASTLESFQKYADPLATTVQEAREFLAANGYTNPTDADIQNVINEVVRTSTTIRGPFGSSFRVPLTEVRVRPESSAITQAEAVADPNVFDINEVKAAAAAEGYALTDEQAKQIVKEANEQEATAAYRASIDPLAVTQAEAADFFNRYGYVPNDDQLRLFIASKPEQEVLADVDRYVNPRQMTLAELESLAAAQGYKLSSDDIKNFVSQGLLPTFEAEQAEKFNKYADPLATIESEAREFLANQGYRNPTQADVNKIVGQILESKAQQEAIGIADPNVFDIGEVKAAAAAENFNLTDEQAAALAREVNEQEATRLYRSEIDPFAVTQQEAQEFFDTFGYKPETDELIQFSVSRPEAEVKPEVGQYVDPRQMTQQEAEALFGKEEYKLDPDEVLQFVRQGKDIQQAQVEADIRKYIDEQTIKVPELMEYYRSLGIDVPAPEDVTPYIGQFVEADVFKDLAAKSDALKLNALKYKIAQDQEAARRRSLGQAGLALVTGSGVTPEETASAPLGPFITSRIKQQEFVSPLEEFMKEAKTGDFTETELIQPSVEPAPELAENTQQGGIMPSYFTYGEPTDIDQLFSPPTGFATNFNPFGNFMAAQGGLAVPPMATGGLPVVHHSGKLRRDYRQGDAVSGPGDGQSDDIPAMLADGEFVIPADVVAALGNGSTKAGSDKLYDMMHSIRAHHRSARPKDLPPPAKSSPLDYLSSRKKARR